MRYLVVGSLPPPVVGRSTSLLAAVSRLEAAGNEVTVRPVGVGDPASRVQGLLAQAGLDVVTGLLRARRRSTTLVLQVEPGLVGAGGPGRVRRAAGLAALSLALTGWERVEIRIDSFADLPSGLGGRAAAVLWRRADAIIVSSEALADAVLAAGVPDATVSVETPAALNGTGPGDAGEHWPADSDEPDVQSVLAVVRRRAAAEQAMSGRRPPDAAAALLVAASGGPAKGPYGPLEPVVRYVYERPALREPARKLRRAIRRPG